MRELSSGLPGQHFVVNGVCHCLVARVLGMQMIAAVEGGQDVSRTVRVASRCVEVDDAIKRAAATDPTVDGLPLLLLIRVIVALKLHAFKSILERCQRGTDNAHPVDMGTGYQLFVPLDNVVSRGRL